MIAGTYVLVPREAATQLMYPWPGSIQT